MPKMPENEATYDPTPDEMRIIDWLVRGSNDFDADNWIDFNTAPELVALIRAGKHRGTTHG